MLTIKSASEDVLCATIARNEVRKNTNTPLFVNGSEFQETFSRFLFTPTSLPAKEYKKAEKERVNKIKAYLEANPDLTLQ